MAKNIAQEVTLSARVDKYMAFWGEENERHEGLGTSCSHKTFLNPNTKQNKNKSFRNLKMRFAPSFATSFFLAAASHQAVANAKTTHHHRDASIPAERAQKKIRTKHEGHHHQPIQSRIVGGFPSASGAFPFFTTVNTEDALCGASLIAEDIVMTAAHCKGAFDDGVRIGVGNINDSSDGVTRQVVKEISHPNYDDITTANDIMLLKLDQPVQGIQPVAWETSTASPTTGDTLTVMGFGATSEGGVESSTLLQVDVKAVDGDTCNRQYNGEVDLDVMFCAGVRQGGKDSCQGDSGGPIVDQTGTQVGIVSWGIGCAEASHPGVYTRVGAFGDWIQQQICEHSNDPDTEKCGGGDGGNSGTDGNNGNSGGTGVDTVIQAKLYVQFDYYAEETDFFLSTLNGDLVMQGPDFWPYEFEEWETAFDLRSGKEYEITVTDTFGDGFQGYFEVYSVDEDGWENVLVWGPQEDFEDSQTIHFVA